MARLAPFSSTRRLDEISVENVGEAGFFRMVMDPHSCVGLEVLAKEVIHHFVAGELRRVYSTCQPVVVTIGHDRLVEYLVGVCGQ